MFTNQVFRPSDIENREELVEHYAYAINASYFEEWKQGLPQLNITEIIVNKATNLVFLTHAGSELFRLRIEAIESKLLGPDPRYEKKI